MGRKNAKIHYISFLRSKSVTSWRGQVRCELMSVVSRRYPNSIRLQRPVANLLAVSLTSLQQVGSFPVYREVTGKRV